jgi:hypothetical protein
MDDNMTTADIPHDTQNIRGGHNDRYWHVHQPDNLDWHTAVWPQDRDSYPVCYDKL